MYIKSKNIMVSGSNDRTLRLWDVQTYQCVSVIAGINCFLPNSLYLIDKDRVIVGGKNTFCIVNIGKCVIEKKIEDESLGFVYCFMKMNRYKTILCGCERGMFCFYDMSREEYRVSSNNHKRDINALLMIDDNTFLSCSDDYTIKVWKY